jgi:uncharacterized iron-regulated protein
MSRTSRRVSHCLALAAMLVTAVACRSTGESGASFIDPHHERAVPMVDVLERMRAADVILLGEVHDHPGLHAWRTRLLRAYAEFVTAPREPPAASLVMEHFDQRDASELADAVRKYPREPFEWIARAAPTADGVRAAKWDWDVIAPALHVAAERNWPVHPANLTAAELRERQPEPIHRLALPALERLIRAVVVGHCNVLPDAAVVRMVTLQRQRDAGMAYALLAVAQGGRQPILLAGNGHVRRDFGVAEQLTAHAGKPVRVLSIGFIESESETREDAADGYDLVFVLPAHPRPDPCEPFRRAVQPAGRTT